MGSWHSPQSIFNMGHRAIRELFQVPVQVQEKVDGSFFAFGKYEVEGEQEVYIRSKGAVMILDAPEKMFSLAARQVKEREEALHTGWMYRGEYLAKPKHNSLAYDRVPNGNIILFDVCTEEEEYLPYEELVAEGNRIGLEVVPQLYAGRIETAEGLRQFLETTSVLGGQKIEGVVVKPLTPLYGPDKKMLFGKFVSEAFKEVHSKAWKESNPTNGDVIQRISEEYGTPARWNKAIQHLREAGLLTDSPKDIGSILREIPQDILKECEEEIKEKLFRYAWEHIRRGVTRGFPEYYKELLLKLQFETAPQEPVGDHNVNLDSSDSVVSSSPGTIEE